VEKGKWTLLDVNKDGAIALLVQSTTAVVVRIHAARTTNRHQEWNQ
jgi:hypothetical protein